MFLDFPCWLELNLFSNIPLNLIYNSKLCSWLLKSIDFEWLCENIYNLLPQSFISKLYCLLYEFTDVMVTSLKKFASLIREGSLQVWSLICLST